MRSSDVYSLLRFFFCLLPAVLNFNLLRMPGIPTPLTGRTRDVQPGTCYLQCYHICPGEWNGLEASKTATLLLHYKFIRWQNDSLSAPA
jgi:hypothetical protein